MDVLIGVDIGTHSTKAVALEAGGWARHHAAMALRSPRRATVSRMQNGYGGRAL